MEKGLIYPIEEIVAFCLETDKKNESVYIARGQFNRNRRLQQNFSGKISELYLNDLLNAGDSKHILKDYGMGKFHSDLTYNGKGISIKSQDMASAKKFGGHRFIFGTNDPMKSDLYCGIMVEYIGERPSDDFETWVRSIDEIKCSISFICEKSVLENKNLWEDVSSYLKGKKVLCASKIPAKDRFIEGFK